MLLRLTLLFAIGTVAFRAEGSGFGPCPATFEYVRHVTHLIHDKFPRAKRVERIGEGSQSLALRVYDDESRPSVIRVPVNEGMAAEVGPLYRRETVAAKKARTADPDGAQHLVIPFSTFDLGERNLPAIGVPYIKGGTLGDNIHRFGAGAAPADILRIWYEIARGTQSLHNIDHVHRDIKPSNVLLEKDAEGVLHAKLSDMGFATPRGERAPSLGSPGYVAPHLDHESLAELEHDLYSIKATFVDILKGSVFLADGATPMNSFMRPGIAGLNPERDLAGEIRGLRGQVNPRLLQILETDYKDIRSLVHDIESLLHEPAVARLRSSG